MLENIHTSKLILLIFAVIFTQAAHTKSNDELKKESQRLTTEIVEMVKSKSDKKLLKDKAMQRKNSLIQLIQKDPAAALALELPQKIKKQMPKDLSTELEQTLAVEGELKVYFVDSKENARKKVVNILETKSGEQIELFLSNKEQRFQSGEKAKVKGLKVKDKDSEFGTNAKMALGPQEDSVTYLKLDGTTSSTSTTLAAALPNTFGEQKTIVILVNFQDNPIQPWQHDEVHNVIFNQSNSFFMENSFQQTWLTGNVKGWYTLPLSSTSCNISDITTAAQAAAVADGVDFSAYKRQIYAFPYTTACRWSGLGSVGGSPSGSWLNGSMRRLTVTHELGHNFGLYHSHSLECGAEIMTGTCSKIEYGDVTDTMGKMAVHYTSFQKELLGWLDTSDILEITSDGTYSIAPYAANKDGRVKTLKVLKGINETNGKKDWYYLEYRSPIGYDTPLTYLDNIIDGITFHTGSESSRNSSYLLDMTPQSMSGDWSDSALIVGASFYDNELGVQFTADNVNLDTASISITGLSGSTPTEQCIKSDPTISVTPATSAWVSAGTTVNYTLTLTLTNNDTSTCQSRIFTLSSSTPFEWSAALTPTQLSITPGQSALSNLAVTSSTSASNGFYEVSLSINDGSVSKSAIVTYVVDNPVVNNSPIANNDSATTEENKAVRINVLANDSDPDGDSLSIISISGVNGTATVNGGQIIFTPATNFTGTEVFTYTITDGNGGNASASVTVTVTQAPVTPPPSTDTTKPTVTLTSPLASDVIEAKSEVTMTADAHDEIGVTKVEFLVNNAVLCTLSAKPYICSFKTAGKRGNTYDLSVRAYDAAGNFGEDDLAITTSGNKEGPGKKR